jgi:hypothetical protein
MGHGLFALHNIHLFYPFSSIGMGEIQQAPLGFINKHKYLTKVNQTFTCRTYSSPSRTRGKKDLKEPKKESM